MTFHGWGSYPNQYFVITSQAAGANQKIKDDINNQKE